MSIKQLEDASAVYKKILEDMAKVDKKYSTEYQEQEVDAPDSLGLQKLTYDMPTQEEVEQSAKQYYSAGKAEDISEINLSTEKTIKDLEDKAKNILAQAVKGQAEINDKRQKDLKSANYSTQVKNLTNSSIKTGIMDKVNTVADQALEILQKDTDNSIADVENKKKEAKSFAEKRLQELEKVYAEKITQKIAEILAEAQKEADAVTKYNNSVDEKEAKYQKSIASQLAELEKQEWKRVAEMLALKKEIGESGIEKQKIEEKYRAVRSVLDQYSPEDALAILEGSSAFKIHLGDMYDSIRAYYYEKSQSKE